MRAKKWEILLALFAGAVAGSGCAFAFGLASARADDVVEKVCADDAFAPDIVYELPDSEPATLARLTVLTAYNDVVGIADNVTAKGGKVSVHCFPKMKILFVLR